MLCDNIQVFIDAWDNETSLWFPQIHECYQHTYLVIIPCFFLLLFLPIVLYSLYKSENGPLEICSPITFKIFFCVILVVDVGALLFYGFYQRNVLPKTTPPYVLYCPLMLYLCLAIALVLLVACKNRGIVTSGVLFNFWLLLAVCGIPEFRYMLTSYIEEHNPQDFDYVRFYLYIIYYPIVVMVLLLSCFVDLPKYKIIEKKTCPELISSFLNQITYHWFTSLSLIGYKRPIVMEDLWDLNSRDASKYLSEKFENVWNKYLQNFYRKTVQPIKPTLPTNNGNLAEREALNPKFEDKNKEFDPPSILLPIFYTFKWPFLAGALYKFCFDVLQFVSPQLLSLLISFVEDKSQPLWVGVSIALLMFIIALVQSLILHQYFHNMFRLGMNIRSILTSMVYKKALYLSNTARKTRTLGEIVNLMSVDIQRIQDMTTFVMLFWSSPLQVLLAVYFLWRLLGVSVVVGLLVLIGLIPLNSWLSVKMRNLQIQQMKHKDERIKMMAEVLNGIKVLKLYAWEDSMKRIILRIRKNEVMLLKKIAYLNAASALSVSCAPFLVAVLTFGVYVMIDPESNILTPQITFVALSLFNILRFPLAVFAMIFSQAIQCAVSNKRIKLFLSEEEVEQVTADDGALSEHSVRIQDGNFSWERNGEPTLANISINIPKGSLVAVIGRTGSGKSSLLSALLGEMHRISGSVTIRGRIAYVPQQAWIQNLSLKRNILFSRSYIESLYNDVIRICSLKRDLLNLPAGDNTEIGERGINLSGGQKQRISLARALYSESDVYLLDDPLSAVDANVGRNIFDHVISSFGFLKNRTRIFVTHGLHYLRHCDQIIVMQDGKITEFGTYEALLSSSGHFSELLEEFLIEEAKNRGRSVSFGEDVDEVKEVLSELERIHPEKKNKMERQLSHTIENDRLSPNLSTKGPQKTKSPIPPNNVPQKPTTPTAKLIEKEAIETGQVKFSVYISYFRAVGYGITILFFIVYVLSSIMGVMSNLWLADWTDHAKEIQTSLNRTDETRTRLGVYTALGMSQAVLISLASIIMALGMVRASRYFHENMLSNVLKSPMAFFDTTPIGRILNRFSKEIDALDTRIPSSILNFLGILIQGIAILSVPIIATPTIVYPLIPTLLAYIYLLRFYVRTSRQLKRLESTSRSPIYSHFQESIQGATSIRAYQCVDRFLFDSQKKVDYNLQSYYPSIVANRWLAVRLELIGNFIVLNAALLSVLFRDNGTITAGLAGLSVAYALNITQTLNWAVRMTSELETNIVAVERIKEYTEIPSEEPEKKSIDIPKSWPTHGIIEFKNLHIRYRSELDYVLKGITCTINSREKIGIVGRTGAGKSSLTLALFRMVDVPEDEIYIDGLDISKINLFDLRSSLTIVPQEPVLFSGTLRINLDPFEQYDDDRIWDALKLTHMDSFVESLPEKLHHKISEGGQNLSVGQKQLICLARALLRKSTILILDEAAASVDMETDQLVQKTIKNHFNDCTVLTIAHRLQSVLNSDRIMVIDDGLLIEYDSPRKLLKNPDSLFYSMAVDAGLAE